MNGSLGGRRNQKGGGHGKENHKHASTSRLSTYVLAVFHLCWRPEKPKESRSKSRKGFVIAKRAKNKIKRKKQ